MTLLRQLMLIMLGLFLLLFCANSVLTLQESRVNLTAQMQAHAQDTATSLGISMREAARDADTATMELLIAATFDHGYYSEITLRDAAGNVAISRQLPTTSRDVPEWFTQLINLPVPAGEADIVSGWSRSGSLYVRSHPGAAYRDLWRMSVSFLALLASLALLAWALFGVTLKVVLAPLAEMEQQAEDIAAQNFRVIERRPRTREFARVVDATNHMARTLSDVFREQVRLTSSLRHEARVDPVTGLANRREFDALVTSLLDSDEGPGPCALILLQLRAFAAVNHEAGRARADELLALVAHRIEGTALATGAIVGRRAGADFGVFLPGITLEKARVALQLVYGAVAAPEVTGIINSPPQVHAGLAFDAAPESLTNLLATADQALRTAQSTSTGGTHLLSAQSDRDTLTTWIASAQGWRERLAATLDARSITLFHQPIRNLADNTLLAHETLARIPDGDTYLSAGTFFPFAERFDMAGSLDQQIIEKLLLDLPAGVPAILNLSTRSIAEAAFGTWLTNALTERGVARERLIVEFPELALQVDAERTTQLMRTVHSLGYRCSMDHLGTSASTFEYLGQLPLAFAKVDRKYVRGLAGSSENRLLLLTLVQMATTRNITLVAEGIETEAERAALQATGIRYGMGFLLGAPGPVRAT